MSRAAGNWYPGLMARTRRFLDRYLGHLDLVLEVVDSRAPQTSRWHGLPHVLKGKPAIVVLNKADLANPSITAAWMEHISSVAGVSPVALDASAGGRGVSAQSRALTSAIRAMGDRSQPKRAIKVAALGVPNAGKSSVLNLIGGRNKAKTGAQPGLTRGQQWIVMPNGIWLLDLPGVLPPAPRDEGEVAKLALIGTLPDGAYSDVDAALFLIAHLTSSMGGGRLGEILRIADDAPAPPAGDSDPLDVLTAWAKRRGSLGAGGQPSLQQAAGMLIAEFRRGGLGRISLEAPPVVQP